MKKMNFENKLKTYSALAVGVLATSANAQVVYTDISDTIIAHSSDTLGVKSYELDLNQDGTSDFKISALNVPLYGDTFSGMGMMGLFNNEIITASSHYGWVLNANDTIAGLTPQMSSWSLHWAEEKINSYTGNMGYFYLNMNLLPGAAVGDKYIGLRIKLSGQWHYGWARLDVSGMDTAQFVIKDFAYNTVADQPLLAGAKTSTTTGTKESNLTEDITVYSYNKTLFVNFNGKGMEKGVVRLYNMSGQEVKSTAVDDINTQIHVEDLANGVYVVSISNNKDVITKKINIK